MARPRHPEDQTPQQAKARLITRLLPVIRAAARLADTSLDVTVGTRQDGKRLILANADVMANLIRQVCEARDVLDEDGVHI